MSLGTVEYIIVNGTSICIKGCPNITATHDRYSTEHAEYVPPTLSEDDTLVYTHDEGFIEKRQLENEIFGQAWPVLWSIHILGIMTNSLMLYVVCRSAANKTTRWILLNLAINDIAIQSNALIWKVNYHTEWLYGRVWCKVITYVQFTSIYVEVYTLLLLACFRYSAMVNPLNVKRQAATRAPVYVSILWISALVFNIPSLIYTDLMSYRTEEGQIDTGVNNVCRRIAITGGLTAGPILYEIFFIWSYLVPMNAVLVLLVLTMSVMRRPSTVLRMFNDKPGKKIALRTLAAITCAYVLCLFPLNFLVITRDFGFTLNSRTLVACELIAIALAHMNSALNPLLYNFFSQQCRQDCVSYVLCSRPSRNKYNQAMRMEPRCSSTYREDIKVVKQQQQHQALVHVVTEL